MRVVLGEDLTLLRDGLIRLLNAYGMEVVSGIIMGLDTDKPDTADALFAFVEESRIPLLTINLLQALPKTPLWDRLERDNRLNHDESRDSNVEFLLPYDEVIASWKRCMALAYQPEKLFARYQYQCEHTSANRLKVPVSPQQASWSNIKRALIMLRKIFWQVGVLGDYRTVFWKFALGRIREIRGVFGFDRRKPQSEAKRAARYRSASARAAQKRYLERLGVTAAACVVFFVIIPGLIYLLSYLPYIREPGSTGGLFNIMTDNQKAMFDYHSRLTDTHPFESEWWKWPLNIKPIWFYSASGLQYTQSAGVVSFGNPLIWWTGIPCLVFAFIFAYRKSDRKMALVFAAFLFQYGPWIFITRATFIYHYFSAVPFMIIAIVYVMRELINLKLLTFRAAGVYLAAAALLFAVYYPILSGLPVTKGYSETLKFFSSWIW